MSVIMRNPRQFKDDTTALLYQNLQNCNCCPYGYHIDLDFVRYCESLVGGKPSDGELLRRDKRRSRKSLEVMLGLDSFCFWEPADKVQPVKEVHIEDEPNSPRVVNKIQNYSLNYSNYCSYYDSSSPNAAIKATLTNPTTKYKTTLTTKIKTISTSADDSSTGNTVTRSTSSHAETSAFLRDALDDVVSDFEKTLERTKKKNKINIPWEQYIDVFDSCVSGNKSTTASTRKDVSTSQGQQQEEQEHQQNEKRQGQQQQQQQQYLQSPQEKEEIESICSNGSELDTQTLQNIREQMAKSLNRMKELEEQVKKIPILQRQLSSLKEEKRQLELQLKKEESVTKNLLNHVTNHVTSNITPTTKSFTHSFTPQKISPIALESLGSRIRSSSPLDTIPKKIIKRDVSVMCVQHTRDIGTLAMTTSAVTVQSVGTNPINTTNIKDNLYTDQEVESLIKASLREYEDRKRALRQQNSVSVATQMTPQIKPQIKHAFTQIMSTENIVPKMSQSVMAVPTKKDVFLTVRPDTQSIGCSDDKISTPLCDKCSVTKKTIGCGPNNEENKDYLSLKQMDMPSRSLSFTLGEYEKLNTRRKTVGTQYQKSVQNVGIQNSAQMESIAIQHSIISLTKSCQYVQEGSSQYTDTRDLVLLVHKNTNTNENKILPSKPVAKTVNNYSNTDVIRTREHGTSTMLLRLVNASSNTEKIIKKDVSCGDVIKPHISISCADNYCDCCKDAIKNLAREFSSSKASKNTGNVSLILSTNGTKIPRPTTLTSPRTTKKLFLRQNTYTIQTPNSSPVLERRQIGAHSQTKRLSASLDSVNILPTPSRSPPQQDKSTVTTASIKSKDNETLSRSYDVELPIADTVVTLSEPSASTKQDDKEEKIVAHYDGGKSIKSTSQPSSSTLSLSSLSLIKTGKDDKYASTTTRKIQELQSTRPQSSQHLQNMLLNQLATSTSEPRTKTIPSKEMKAAMKVINDSLQKSTSKSNNLKNANSIVQKEWFQISSTDKANPLDVEDYLDCFEEFSNSLLKYIVNMTDSNGNTAMHYAVSHGNFDVVSILLDSKVCNVNQTNNAGYTCVMLVSLAKLRNFAHRTVVQRLFQMADVNIRAKKHCQTALMLAVSHGNLDMVEMLLNAGADINIQDEDGSTALMCAAEHGGIDIVKHLLSQPECDSLIQDVDGSTAFKIAWQAGHRDIGLLLYVHEQMLRSKMPNVKSEQRSPATPRHQKAYQMHQQQQQKPK